MRRYKGIYSFVSTLPALCPFGLFRHGMVYNALHFIPVPALLFQFLPRTATPAKMPQKCTDFYEQTGENVPWMDLRKKSETLYTCAERAMEDGSKNGADDLFCSA